MPKFSIIIPIYNVEKYIKKCLDSIFNQSYKDFEVIVVNDGTKDNSMQIVKDYDVIIINQENQGLSEARNNGVKKAKGEYLLFIDSDDYIEKDTLKEIEKVLDTKPDLVRFQIREVFENHTKEYSEEPFDNKSGEEAFKIISGYHFVENACCYAIRREYYTKNRYQLKKGMLHEDFGLIPLVIIKSNKVTSIPYICYNYVKRSNSIMNSNNYDLVKKKVSDMYSHYRFLFNEIDKTKLDTTYFKSFVANSMLLKICSLKNREYKEYLNRLKKENIFDYLLTDTFSRRIKKIFIKISPKLYFKINH